ncbi:LacI family DNA-binding transcriptional regulator [Pseudonocardia sp. DSM 110487]|nr:LacI family DNA-binding transcriptional regulator [Pseudonocardia sp. DSM 110487]
MRDRPTIYDVAREAGVAASTVSRAYSRPGRSTPRRPGRSSPQPGGSATAPPRSPDRSADRPVPSP